MKDQLLKGTLILTIAGIITRLIGFVYRIFLAGELGEINLGIYQLVFPLYTICFTIYRQERGLSPGVGATAAVAAGAFLHRKMERTLGNAPFV